MSQLEQGFHVSDAFFTGTPFSDRTTRLNYIHQRFVAWDIYHVVDVFTDVQEELRAIREAVGVIEMSPLAKYDFVGPDAERYVNYLITRDARKIQVGQIFWAAWCDHDGKIISDGMVFRLADNHFRITGDPSYVWFQQNKEGFDVEITDITHDRGILSLQGPKSLEVMEAVTGEDWSEFKFSRVRMARIGGVDVEVARQGFTGEHGYELCVAKEDAIPMWDAVLEAGKEFGIKPCGLETEGLARMEAGLIIPGPDYTKGGPADDRGAAVKVEKENTVSPFECRMGKFVDFDKGDFLGRTALLEEKEKGSKQDMVGLLIDWTGIAELFVKQDLPPVVMSKASWVPLPVFESGRKIGRATSAAYSPAAKSVAAFGFLEKNFCTPGTKVSVEFEVNELKGLVDAEVVQLPFLELKRAK